MQFVARDGRAFGDVAERDLDVELRERLLHEPRVGHQFLLRLGRLDGHVRVLEKIHRRQLVIADDRRLRDGDGLGLAAARGPGRRDAGNFDFRLGLFLGRFFRVRFFSGPLPRFLLRRAVPSDFSSAGFLPRISSVVAAPTSFAGITSPSSAGAGAGAAGIFDSGKVVLRKRPPVTAGLACGTLKSRTVGSGTGCPSAPRPERATSSCNFFACFSRSRARRSRAISSGDFCSDFLRRRRFLVKNARIHSPSWKLVRNSRLINASAE